MFTPRQLNHSLDSAARALRAFQTWLATTRFIWPVLLALLVGGGMGGLAIVAATMSTKWAGVILVAAAAPVVALLVKDLRQLVLIAFVVDIPLGIDIAIPDLEWHQGGPTGYMISLMTIALLAGYALWLAEQKPKLRFFPQITVPAMLYLFMIAVSFYQSRHLQLSSFGLFLQGQLLLMYFYMANHVQTWDDVRLVIIVMVICLLLESALMVMQYFTGTALDIGLVSSHSMSMESVPDKGTTGPRIGGTIGGPNSAAVYLAPTLAISLAAYLSGKSAPKMLTLAALGLGMIALIATASRSAWGGLSLAVAILLARVVWTEAGKKAIPLLLVGALSIGLFFGPQIYQRLAAAQTDNSRPELATMAYNIIAHYPLGVGENNYDLVMSDKYAHPNWVGHTHYPVHNKYLLIWAETGPQGLAAFCLLLIGTAWQARRWLLKSNPDPHLVILAAGLFGALGGYAFHMTTEGFASRSNVQILWFMIAMTAAISHLMDQAERAAVPAGTVA